MLANDLRSFGLQAPQGGTWYDFDPVGYLECAARGAFATRRIDPDTIDWILFEGFLLCGQIYE